MSVAQTPPMRPRRISVLNLILVFLLGLFAARLPATMAQLSSGRGGGDPFELISDVYRAILRDYVDVPDKAKVAQGAIEGMLQSLDDPYAEFVPAEDRTEFEKGLTGQFVGIGCQIEVRDGWLTCVTPLDDSPALRAGVLADDRISKIEETSTFGLSPDECIKLLQGTAGTPVNITVERKGQVIPFKLIRAQITNKSARGFRRIPDNSNNGRGGHWDYIIDPANRIAYVRLSQFTPTATEELAEAIQAAQAAMSDTQSNGGSGKGAGGSAASIGGLILDLRSNPGGVMDDAIEIADLFLKSGPIMSVKGRGGAPDQLFKAEARGTLPDFPMLVMVNGQSASASEIVAGALQDQQRAIVLGQRTYGKGLVQAVRPLPHDQRTQLKFTIQRYYLPSGRSIQRTDDSDRWGVDPDPGFFVPMTDDELVSWFQRRRDFDIFRNASPGDAGAVQPGTAVPADASRQLPAEEHWNDPTWLRDQAKDKQLAAALTAMRERLSTGQWKPVSDEKIQYGKIAERELASLERSRERLTRELARIDRRLDTLERSADAGAQPVAATPPDLWPDSLDLTNGRITVTDKSGKEIATLRITGRDVERWLTTGDVKPERTSAPPAPTAPDGGKK